MVRLTQPANFRSSSMLGGPDSYPMNITRFSLQLTCLGMAMSC